MAVVVHNIYNGNSGNFQQGTPWFQVYVDYAVANGIISPGGFNNYGKLATRAEMAYIFSRCVPQWEFAAINEVNFLPDVSKGSQYSDNIFMLYRAGVLSGSDAKGTFSPNSNITRAEAAAIISRVVLPVERKILNLQDGRIDVDSFFNMTIGGYLSKYTENYWGGLAGGEVYNFAELPEMTFIFTPREYGGSLSGMWCPVSMVFPAYKGMTLDGLRDVIPGGSYDYYIEEASDYNETIEGRHGIHVTSKYTYAFLTDDWGKVDFLFISKDYMRQ